MTILNTELYPYNIPRPPVTRKDVLGLASVSSRRNGEYRAVSQNIKRLESLGFKVSQMAPQHWVLQRCGRLLELHLYGAEELTRFVSQRAVDYANRSEPATPCTKEIS